MFHKKSHESQIYATQSHETPKQASSGKLSCERKVDIVVVLGLFKPYFN
jgi:hypothetical protein